ncbi:MAG: flagellar hook-basal body complex protein FliE [Conexibacter sp.]
MTLPPIDPSPALGGEWQVPGIGATGASPPAGTDSGFGGVLAQQITKLSELQESAANASQSLADGTATDPSTVVVAVEKAQLAMQLAGQIRTKGAEAVNDIFHTQI